MKKTISKMLMTAAFAVTGVTGTFAQTNLGADCGCPSIANRTTTVNLSTLAVVGGANDGDLTAVNTLLTCDKRYILDKKIFVPDGKTLTIQPGTAIFSNTSGGANANALIVSRGGKIIAAGTETCPIVFTVNGDPMDGSYTPSNQQQWGGLVLLGKATNNLSSASCGSLYISPGVGLIEGFGSSDPRAFYGAVGGVFDDNDNSGIVRYVSLRHGGATVSTANELNGLTCGSVGRGTTLDHIEIVSNSDDGFEFFGGTVNLKYGVVQWGDDDGFDWDHGYSGKGQFWFGIKGGGRGDNGFEMDSDDNSCAAAPNSHPVIYNATFIGDDTDAGLEAKELTEGEIYNSIFANFQQGFNLYDVRTPDAYDNWIAGSLKVNNCTFLDNAQSAFTIQTGSISPAAGSDLTKFTADGNLTPASIPGFDFTFSITLANNALTAVTDVYDAIPNPNLPSTLTPPADGFFTPVNYRGAFASNQPNWMKNWTYSSFIDASNGLVACPNDVNNDGVVNVSDFNSVLGAFGTSCD